MPRYSRLLVLLSFAAIYIIWGSTYLAIRIGIETIPPFLLAGTRFFLAGAPFYLWLRWQGHARPSREHWRSALLLGSLMMFGGNGLVTWAEQSVPSAIAAVLITTVPLWMTILDRLFSRGPGLSAMTVFGLVVGFAGVVVLVGPTGADVDRVDPIGAAVLLLAAFLWSVGSLRSRRGGLPGSPLMGAAMQMVCGGLVLLAMGTITGEWSRLDVASVSGRSVAAMLYLVVFGSVVALSAYVYLLRVSSASAVSTYAFANPIIAVALGAVVGGERIGAQALVSMALIIGAVGIILVSRRRQAAVRPVAASSGRDADPAPVLDKTCRASA